MASRHFEAAKGIEVELLVGMTALDGIAVSNHKGFQKLVTGPYEKQFTCSYLYTPPAVHSKVYVWLKDKAPVQAFLGSANYTSTGFGTKQREVLSACDPDLAFAYFNNVLKETVYCTIGDIENYVTIYSDQQFIRRKQKGLLPGATEALQTVPQEEGEGLDDGLVTLCWSLLADDGELKQISGLNWGQRENRRGNEAYIRVPAVIGNRKDFFPEIATHFTVLTDDDKVMICSRAQSGGKAIHTPKDNAEIGLYFRRRLGVEPHAMVLKEDLERHGRTEVCFTKIDEETFYMDFS